MPSDQMVRYWQGKEENDETSVSEYIAATLKANMQALCDLAYDKERDEKVKQKFYHDQKDKERTSWYYLDWKKLTKYTFNGTDLFPM